MKEELRHPQTGPKGEPGPDPRLAEALRALDPGSTDRGYWLRFHRNVMEAAHDELARRRMLADVTVSELVTSWARAVVPTALLAAAVAAFLLLRLGGPVASPLDGSPVALEEMFGDGLGGEWVAPSTHDAGMDVTFASEAF